MINDKKLAEKASELAAAHTPYAVATVVGELNRSLPQLADAFSGRTRIPVSVTVSSASQLPPDVNVAFYRVAQEALNNIAKHADASEVSLAFERSNGEARLTIVDNGRGFDPAAVSTEGLGLSIMHERAAAIGGQLDLNSRRGTGTTLIMVWSAADMA